MTRVVYKFIDRYQPLLPYGFASFAATLGVCLTLLLHPLVGTVPFVILTAVVMISARYGGLGPGLLATGLTVLASSYFLIPPIYTLNVTEPDDLFHLGLFVLVALLISSLSHRLRAAQQQAAALVCAQEEGLLREQRARAEAEAATRAKNEFVAMVSHELRTPLNAIIGWAGILRRSGATDEENFEQALESIERNAKLQAELIKDLLDMSRIIAGKLHLDIRPVALATIVDAAVSVVRPAAEARDIDLCVEKALAPTCVSGDPARLQQVLWNLLSNAVKFTPEHGRIEIKLEAVGSQAQVVVSDTGKGISAEFLPYVFDRFRQAEPQGASRHDGLGLGLAIAHHLIGLHGGTIHAASPGANQGSTFTIRLPLLAAKPTHALEERPSLCAMAAQ